MIVDDSELSNHQQKPMFYPSSFQEISSGQNEAIHTLWDSISSIDIRYPASHFSYSFDDFQSIYKCYSCNVDFQNPVSIHHQKCHIFLIHYHLHHNFKKTYSVPVHNVISNKHQILYQMRKKLTCSNSVKCAYRDGLDNLFKQLICLLRFQK